MLFRVVRRSSTAHELLGDLHLEWTPEVGQRLATKFRGKATIDQVVETCLILPEDAPGLRAVLIVEKQDDEAARTMLRLSEGYI